MEFVSFRLTWGRRFALHKEGNGSSLLREGAPSRSSRRLMANSPAIQVWTESSGAWQPTEGSVWARQEPLRLIRHPPSRGCPCRFWQTGGVSGIVRKLDRDKRLRDSLLRLLEDHLKQFDLLLVDQTQLE